MLYKNCRWCHWYKDGECLQRNTFKGSSVDVRHLSEEGVIDEAIREGFTNQLFPELQHNLESSLSKKKAKAFMQAFYEELEAVKNDWVISIDELVTATIQHEIDKSNSARVVDPEEFYCKYFM